MLYKSADAPSCLQIFRGSHGNVSADRAAYLLQRRHVLTQADRSGLLQSRPAKDKQFPLTPWWHGSDLDSVPSIPPEPRRYTDVDRPPPAPRLPEPQDL